MAKADRKTLIVIACACFVVHMGNCLFTIIQYRAPGQIPNLVIYLLLIIGLTFFKSPFIVASSVLAFVISIIGAGTSYVVYSKTQNVVALITGILSVVSSILFIFLGFSKRKCVFFGYVIAAVQIISVLLTYFGWLIPGLGGLRQPVRFIRFLLPFLWIAGIIITGYLRKDMLNIDELWQQFKQSDYT